MDDQPTADRLFRGALTRRQLLRGLGLGGLAVSLPGVLAACGGGGSSATTEAAGTSAVETSTAASTAQIEEFRVLAKGGVDSLKITGFGPGLAAISTEPVLAFDKDLNIVGHLAESWEAVDPVTYVYKVRQGVRFWDGSPLTVEDMAFSMGIHLDPQWQSQLAGVIPPVDTIDVTGPDEVTVRLKEPNATWPYLPMSMAVVPKTVFLAQGLDFGAPDGEIMGSGPYIPEEFRAGEFIRFVRSDHYWGETPVIQTMIWTGVPDVQTIVLAMRADEGDIAWDIPATAIPDVEQLDNVTVMEAPTSNLAFASFDVEAEPWSDIHVRKAFAHALDREGLLSAINDGNGTISNSIVPRNEWATMDVPDDWVDEVYASLPVYEFDLDKARAELQQSAYPDGLTAEIWLYAGNDRSQKMALTWAAGLKEIGVTLELDPVSPEEGYAREDQHKNLGLSIHAWPGTDMDPIDWPITLLPTWAAKPLYYNEANYKNPQVDALIEQNLKSTDPMERAEAVAEIMRIVADDLPYFPLWIESKYMVINDTFVYDDGSPEGQFQYKGDVPIGLWPQHIRLAS